MPVKRVRKGEPIGKPCQGGVVTVPCPEDGLLITSSDQNAAPVLITNSALAAEGYGPLKSVGRRR